MDCIFCKIVERQAPAEIIYEDDAVIAFLDTRPMNFGHTLVIPKCHCENFLELPNNSIPNIFGIAQKVAFAVQDSLQCSGFNLVVNNGKDAGQSVFHFHVHIIPRFSTDSFRFDLNFKRYNPEEIIEIGKKIRNHI
ncbi:MAG: HIT family protein [Ignavibacteria bacterium]|nr:HIT family protein [Ignavibacteria bacterium]